MKYQIAFRQYILKKIHRYGLLWKSLNNARFPYIYKSVAYAAKPQAGDGRHYIKTTIDYVKYVQDIKKQQSIKDRTISSDPLYTSIELTVRRCNKEDRVFR